MKIPWWIFGGIENAQKEPKKITSVICFTQFVKLMQYVEIKNKVEEKF